MTPPVRILKKGAVFFEDGRVTLSGWGFDFSAWPDAPTPEQKMEAYRSAVLAVADLLALEAHAVPRSDTGEAETVTPAHIRIQSERLTADLLQKVSTPQKPARRAWWRFGNK